MTLFSKRIGGQRGLIGNSTFQRRTVGIHTLPLLSILLILIALPHAALAGLVSRPFSPASTLHTRAANQTALLQCLEVVPPVLDPVRPTCQRTLMVHTFGSSYGVPYVGNYTPPECDFNRVTINFTVTSAGRQFDRLALMFLNDIEVWRTSTAEPTANGIIWSYVKDMSNFLSLWKEPQKIIFDLGNIQDDTYTGAWNTTLTATFFTAEDDIKPADTIIPVSARKSSSDVSSAFVVPDSAAINSLTLPRNAQKAVFSISACGQATEEFWWSNVLQTDIDAFNGSTLYGYSPFRELQLFIDGQMAGVAWPFPVIFTGGIVPGFWRPVVGIDAFDLREDEIDITPFLPILSDGKNHSFEIKVAGITDDGQGNAQLVEAVGSNWVVTGKVFLWLDKKGSATTGSKPTISAPEASLKVHSSSGNGLVTSLQYSVDVARIFSVTSTVKTSSGSKSVTWKQNLKYSNQGNFTDGGNTQATTQRTQGSSTSTNGYSRSFDYPLYVWNTYQVLNGGNYSIDGKMSRSKNVQQIGDLAFPNIVKTFSRAPQYGSTFTGSTVTNTQNGTAGYLSAPALKRSFGHGMTEQWYTLNGLRGASTTGGTELWRRHVLAVNDTLIGDEQSFGGASAGWKVQNGNGRERPVFAGGRGIKAMLGRGPP
jgi:hypothetical protein